MTEFQRVGLFLIVCCLCLCTGIGCGGSGKTVVDITGKNKMEEVAHMLKLLKLEGKKPPAKLADLDVLEPSIPLAVQDLRSGDIVYLWGADLSDAPGDASKIVAYEKAVPIDGGWVLTQDGAAKEMSVADFNAAQKAK